MAKYFSSWALSRNSFKCVSSTWRLFARGRPGPRRLFAPSESDSVDGRMRRGPAPALPLALAPFFGSGTL
eukprot:2357324-Pyramimonas_sp.AAC.1